LELFDSEESVERDYLKNILHKLYAKVSIEWNLTGIQMDKILTKRCLNIILIVGTQKKDDQKGY
jgi:hypothetical protein